MKLILIIFIFCAFSISKNGATSRHSLFPPPPAQFNFDSTTTHIQDKFTDYIFTQINMTILGVTSLKDELSYNCLTNNFQLALSLPSTTTLDSIFDMEGYFDIFWNRHQINITGEVKSNCSPSNACLLVGIGQIIPDQIDNFNSPIRADNFNSPIRADNFTVNLQTFESTFTFRNGTINDVPIEEVTQLDVFHALLSSDVHRGVAQNMAALLQSYLNDVILVDMTHADLMQLTGGDCGENERASIIPELPTVIKFDPVTHFKIDYFYNVSYEHTRTVADFSGMRDELSYNCFTREFEWAILINEFSAHGPFYMEGGYGEVIEDRIWFNATGLVEELCPQLTPNGCLLRAVGQILEGGVDLELNTFKFNLEHDFGFEFYNFTVQEAYVDGHYWEEAEEYMRTIKGQLQTFAFPMWTQVEESLDAFLNQKLQKMTMAQLVAMTGGSC